MADLKRQHQISAELSRIIGETFLNVEFPGKTLVTITRIRVSQDLKYADIFLAVLPREGWNGVKNVLKKIQRDLLAILRERLTIQRPPQLRFVLDEQEEKARHLESLLDEIAKKP